MTRVASSLLTMVEQAEPVMLFDLPNSAPLDFEARIGGDMIVTFSTQVYGQNGGSPFEWLLWIDDGPSPTMPAPATIMAQAGGTSVSSTQAITLPAGRHLVQVVVRSPSGVPLTLNHSHLITMWVPTPPP